MSKTRPHRTDQPQARKGHHVLPCIALAALLGACHPTGHEPPQTNSPPDPPPTMSSDASDGANPAAEPTPEAPYLPRQRAPEGDREVLQALVEGTLHLDDGCLRLRTPNEDYLMLWPPGYTARRDGEEVVVLDDRGTVRARTGEPLAFGGGELRDRDHAESLLEAALPAGCDGPFWLAGEPVG